MRSGSLAKTSGGKMKLEQDSRRLVLKHVAATKVERYEGVLELLLLVLGHPVGGDDKVNGPVCWKV